jgi:hypothetical protein
MVLPVRCQSIWRSSGRSFVWRHGSAHFLIENAPDSIIKIFKFDELDAKTFVTSIVMGILMIGDGWE